MWHGHSRAPTSSCQAPLHSSKSLNMAEVQSQSASIPESKIESQTDKDALIIRLDELLENYLHTLDQYQKTREQLSKQLSSVRRLISAQIIKHFANSISGLPLPGPGKLSEPLSNPLRTR
jgi:hypothetical protein